MEVGLSVTLEPIIPGLGGLFGLENQLILDARREWGKGDSQGAGAAALWPVPSSAQSPAPRCLIQAPCPLLCVRSANGTTSRKSEASERRVRPTQGCPRGATPTWPQPTEGPGTHLVPARTPPSLHRELCSPAAFSPGP